MDLMWYKEIQVILNKSLLAHTKLVHFTDQYNRMLISALQVIIIDSPDFIYLILHVFCHFSQS